MQGISPRLHSLSPQQIQISNTVAETVPELPTTVTDLISEMAVPDFSIATATPDLTLTGTVIRNERNRQILLHIELALTAPSSECDPTIKSRIFDTAAEQRQTGRTISLYLIQIIQGIKEKGLQLNLDDVELGNFNLKDYSMSFLDGMSARRATFSNMNMVGVNMRNADFAGAKFINTNLSYALLSKANIADATFSNVTFKSTEARELIGNQSAITKKLESHPVLKAIDDEMYTTEKTFLTGHITSALPDGEKFTLPVDQNVIPYVSHYGDYPTQYSPFE